MTNFGVEQRGKSAHDFMVAFEEFVIKPDNPPFMSESFKCLRFDPFRFLAEIFSSTAYAEGDPYVSIQPLAFGSGDSDTVTSFLGTLMGAWYGEKALKSNFNLTSDLQTLERVLSEVFKIDLQKQANIFLRLQKRLDD